MGLEEEASACGEHQAGDIISPSPSPPPPPPLYPKPLNPNQKHEHQPEKAQMTTYWPFIASKQAVEVRIRRVDLGDIAMPQDHLQG